MGVLSSRDNPTVKRLRELGQSARAVRESGQTLLVGVHLIECCLAAGHPIRQWLLSAGNAGDVEVTRLLRRHSAPMIELSAGLFHELVQQATGNVAAVIDVPRIESKSKCQSDGDLVALDAVQDAGNVGTLLRTAAAAGAREIWLGTGCAGAWTLKVLRAGQGAQFGLAIREGVDLVPELQACGLPVTGAVAAQGKPLYASDLRHPRAWVFGSEGGGISAAVDALLTQRVTIPMAAGVESLNVAGAAAVCLFEAVRQRGA